MYSDATKDSSNYNLPEMKRINYDHWKRMCSTMEGAQYCRDFYKVLSGDKTSTLGVYHRAVANVLVMWRMFSTMEGNHQYCREIPSVLLRNAIQYCGGCSVLWRGTVSTVEDVHCCGGIPQYCQRC